MTGNKVQEKLVEPRGTGCPKESLGRKLELEPHFEKDKVF